MKWRMLQLDTPEDFVIATGIRHSVRYFVNAAAAELDIQLEWKGRGIEETAVIANSGSHRNLKRGQTVVRVDPRYFRPTDIEVTLGDATKAREKLGWKPTVSFDAMVKEMVLADLDAASKDPLTYHHDYARPAYHD